jgi:hypothetical protein
MCFVQKGLDKKWPARAQPRYCFDILGLVSVKIVGNGGIESLMVAEVA